jgi:hypothetical protein
MLAGHSTGEANIDTAKTQIEETRPDLKQTSQVEARRSKRFVHSNKWAGHTPIAIFTGQVEAFADIVRVSACPETRLISDDVTKRIPKCLSPAELLILVFPIPPGDAG